MGHHTVRQGYKSFADRLNLLPQGAPVSDSLYALLQVLVDEREAMILSKLPVRPFNVEKAAKALHLKERECEKILEELASKAMLLDVVNHKGERIFTLPPPIAGFFEFSLMRLGGSNKDQQIAELLYQYLNVEDDFIKELFLNRDIKIARFFVNEEAVKKTEKLGHHIEILDYEKASHIIKTARTIAVGTCYCRHKAEHLGTNCNAPIEDICITLGNVAESLSKHGYARTVSVNEGIRILENAYDYNLVQMGENEQQELPFICNCCGCCCECLQAVKKHGTLSTIQTTNFVPETTELCIGCGKCETICPVNAITMTDIMIGEKSIRRPQIDESVCLGCGVCVRACIPCGLRLTSRGEREITPVNSAHRIILNAIEQDKLQNLIFDNQALASHRVMAAILGAILKLPPVKRALVADRMQSIYIKALIGKQ